MNRKLAFRQDGTFTIVQFTDLHWHNGEQADLRTRDLMRKVLRAEKPDLIMISGDLIYSLKCADPLKSLRQALAAVESSGIPWAAVLGNHDAERKVTRAELMEIMMEHSGCVAQPGPANVYGIGNYVVRIGDNRGRTRAALYGLDSGALSEAPGIKGYDWIRRSQIEWYVRQSKQLTAENDAETVPSLAFFHIPLPEYEELWRTQTCYGQRHERAACPPVNSGFFAAMAERGDVMGTFCGHDHTNDYWGAMQGIRLCYGRASGYQAYGRTWYSRGARVIRLTLGERRFESWVRLHNGRVILHPREHHPRGYWWRKLRRWLDGK